MSRYKILDHTADYAVEVRAKTVSGLVRNAIFAMFSGLFDHYSFSKEAEGERIEFGFSESLEEFLFNTLRELLFVFYTRNLMPASVSLRKNCLLVTLTHWDAVRMPRDMEIKAVTRHMFAIEKKGDFLMATIVFDV